MAEAESTPTTDSLHQPQHKHTIPLVEIFPNNFFLRYIHAPLWGHPFLLFISTFASLYLYYCGCVAFGGGEGSCHRQTSNLLHAVTWACILMSSYVAYLRQCAKDKMKKRIEGEKGSIA
ncbi:hypothetical protein BDV18DRAFT_161870 [Aspergillus unguis]